MFTQLRPSPEFWLVQSGGWHDWWPDACVWNACLSSVQPGVWPPVPLCRRRREGETTHAVSARLPWVLVGPCEIRIWMWEALTVLAGSQQQQRTRLSDYSCWVSWFVFGLWIFPWLWENAAGEALLSGSWAAAESEESSLGRDDTMWHRGKRP